MTENWEEKEDNRTDARAFSYSNDDMVIKTGQKMETQTKELESIKKEPDGNLSTKKNTVTQIRILIDLKAN